MKPRQRAAAALALVGWYRLFRCRTTTVLGIYANAHIQKTAVT